MLLLSIFADLFEWRKHIDSQTHLCMFVLSKCLLLSVRTGFRSKQQEGQGLGLVHSLLSGLWMLRCPTLRAFFESLAQWGLFFFLLSSTLFTLVQRKYLSFKKYTAYRSHKPTICLGGANTPVQSRIQAGSLFLLLSGKGNWRDGALPWGPALFELPHAKIAG